MTPTPIRSSREKLSGGGRPSGPMSFLKVYDQVANVVKSGGDIAPRRGEDEHVARLARRHRGIHRREAEGREEGVWALIEQGLCDGSYNGDAYGSVMYQNENLSVRASDEFLKGPGGQGKWWTRTVTGEKPLQKKDVRRHC